MLGRLNPEHREVTIVGAGIAGLLLAEQLDRNGWTVTLLESAERAGGLIRTTRKADGPVEQAAHSILATPAVLEVCERLGVELVGVRPEARARWIWRGGRLRRFPLSLGEAFRAFFRAYLMLSHRYSVGTPEREALSLEAWGLRHLGKAATQYLLTPFVRGIYGARPAEISVAMAFPSLMIPPGHSLVSWFLRRKIVGLFSSQPKRPRAKMMTPKNGMGALTDALTARLKERLGDRFKTGVEVRVPPHSKNLVLCVPAPQAATILSAEDPVLAQALSTVAYAPLVSVGTFVDRAAFGKNPPHGVGVLLPEGTSRKSLGILFNSSSFEGRVQDESQRVSLTVMLGGTTRPELCPESRTSDDEIRSIVRDDLSHLLGMARDARIDTSIHRYERAVPCYGPLLKAAWDAAHTGWCSKPGRVLFANYTGQVSIRGMIETVLNLSKPG